MTVLKVGHQQTLQRAEFIKEVFAGALIHYPSIAEHSFAMRTLGQSAQYFQMTFWLTEERWEPQRWVNIWTLKKLPLIAEIFFITAGIYFSLSVWKLCTCSGVSGCLQSVCLTQPSGCVCSTQQEMLSEHPAFPFHSTVLHPSYFSTFSSPPRQWDRL